MHLVLLRTQDLLNHIRGIRPSAAMYRYNMGALQLRKGMSKQHALSTPFRTNENNRFACATQK